MSDGFPMDCYGRSEKHISFAFTLKADTQLGREENLYLYPGHLCSGYEEGELRVIVISQFSQRLLIKYSFQNSQTQSQP